MSTRETGSDEVVSGTLSCPVCDRTYPILNGVPRFVELKNYADNFGFEWNRHARTQYDSYSGVNVSETRFFGETKWGRDLTGRVLLEVGCGSGRFTVHAAATGAMVVSFDYSAAVEANYASNGGTPNVLIVQADVYRLPFPKGFFDGVFCFGVLQHTPDVRKTFFLLSGYLKSGGRLVADVYRKFGGVKRVLKTKYWVRSITKRLRPAVLYRLTRSYVNFMWPLSRYIHKLPYGKLLNWALFIADYRGVFPLTEELLKEWAILDTFDMLSPRYDKPQTLAVFTRWFHEAGLRHIDVHYGYNGIEGRAEKP